MRHTGEMGRNAWQIKQWRPLHSPQAYGAVERHLLKHFHDGKTAASRHKHSEIIFLKASLCALYQIGDAVSLVETH